MVDLADRLTWPRNLWVGVSIESAPYSYRANHLRRFPSAVRFVSAEPLLGPLPSLNLTQVDWLIVGESGHHARPMHQEWAGDLRDRCRDANVAFFFKQWGSWAPADGPTAVTIALRRIDASQLRSRICRYCCENAPCEQVNGWTHVRRQYLGSTT